MTNVVRVSRLEYVSVCFCGVLIGIWITIKRSLRYLWNFKKENRGEKNIENRDTAPSWLFDGTFGQHKYVKLKKIKLHYVEAGHKDSPPLILFHGFPDCWVGWRHQIPFLSEHYRVLAVDLKGFGDSDKPTQRKEYRVHVLLDEIRQFAHVLSLKKFVLIGHDVGGLLGWFLCYESPDLVERFVAVSCPHPNIFWHYTGFDRELGKRWVNFVQLPGIPEREILAEELNLISNSFGHFKDTDCDIFEAYKYAFSRKEDWSGALNYFRNFPFIRIDEKSPQIKIPTLLITGNKCINLEGTVKSTDYCDRFYVKIIEGAGRFPHQENPETFAKIIQKFLKIRTTNNANNNKINQGLMNRMIGAMSTTVKYGNSVLDSVNKKANGIVHMKSFS